MINERTNLKLDLSIIVLMAVYFGIVLVFIYGGFAQDAENLGLLFLLMIGALSACFWGMSLALMGAVVFDFTFATWHIYLNVSKGLTIQTETYVWMLLFPIVLLTTGFVGQQIQQLQRENKVLRKNNTELVTIDSMTGLKTHTIFLQDMVVFMNLSKRYGLSVSLMLIEFKYHSEMLDIIGKDQFENLVIEISDLLGGTTRYEDNKYVLNDYKKFAILFVSDDLGSEILRNRIKEKIHVLAKEDTVFKKYRIELKVGIARVQQNHELPYEVIEAAEKDMEYDL